MNPCDERACLEVYSELLADAIGKMAGEALSIQHSAFSQTKSHSDVKQTSRRKAGFLRAG
jgi:hypothetical protein